jgi:hypothetical protein
MFSVSETPGIGSDGPERTNLSPVASVPVDGCASPSDSLGGSAPFAPVNIGDVGDYLRVGPVPHRYVTQVRPQTPLPTQASSLALSYGYQRRDQHFSPAHRSPNFGSVHRRLVPEPELASPVGAKRLTGCDGRRLRRTRCATLRDRHGRCRRRTRQSGIARYRMGRVALWVVAGGVGAECALRSNVDCRLGPVRPESSGEG